VLVPLGKIVNAGSAHSGTVPLALCRYEPLALCRWINEVDAHFSGADSGASRVTTPAPPLSVLLVTHSSRAALV